MTVTLVIDRYSYTPGEHSRSSDPKRLPPVKLEWPDELPPPSVGVRVVMGARRGTIRGVTVDLGTGEVTLNVDEYAPREEVKP